MKVNGLKLRNSKLSFSCLSEKCNCRENAKNNGEKAHNKRSGVWGFNCNIEIVSLSTKPYWEFIIAFREKDWVDMRHLESSSGVNRVSSVWLISTLLFVPDIKQDFLVLSHISVIISDVDESTFACLALDFEAKTLAIVDDQIFLNVHNIKLVNSPCAA